MQIITLCDILNRKLSLGDGFGRGLEREKKGKRGKGKKEGRQKRNIASGFIS